MRKNKIQNYFHWYESEIDCRIENAEIPFQAQIELFQYIEKFLDWIEYFHLWMNWNGECKEWEHYRWCLELGNGVINWWEGFMTLINIFISQCKKHNMAIKMRSTFNLSISIGIGTWLSHHFVFRIENFPFANGIWGEQSVQNFRIVTLNKSLKFKFRILRWMTEHEKRKNDCETDSRRQMKKAIWVKSLESMRIAMADDHESFECTAFYPTETNIC